LGGWVDHAGSVASRTEAGNEIGGIFQQVVGADLFQASGTVPAPPDAHGDDAGLAGLQDVAGRIAHIDHRNARMAAGNRADFPNLAGVLVATQHLPVQAQVVGIQELLDHCAVVGGDHENIREFSQTPQGLRDALEKGVFSRFRF